jgi:hypothetical protein
MSVLTLELPESRTTTIKHGTARQELVNLRKSRKPRTRPHVYLSHPRLRAPHSITRLPTKDTHNCGARGVRILQNQFVQRNIRLGVATTARAYFYSLNPKVVLEQMSCGTHLRFAVPLLQALILGAAGW